MNTTMLLASDTGTLAIGADFKDIRSQLVEKLLETTPKNQGKWQQLDVSKSDAHATYELLNVSVWFEMPIDQKWANINIGPDLPWAEGHFQERVAGKAVNPGDWHDKWPFHNGQVELHQHGGRYDHNYMERFWPTGLELEMAEGYFEDARFQGYRFPVGDLDDVVRQLVSDRGTRQAYLPIFFPEDTGATEGQRVPCTLGYHFIIRDDVLHVTYNMRSCEAYRHFTNDTYMAVRLAHWVAEQVDLQATGSGTEQVHPRLDLGQMTMNIVSFHGFVGDTEELELMV